MYRAIRCVRLDGREVLLQVAPDKSSVLINEWNDMNYCLVKLKNINNFEKGESVMKMEIGNVDIECTWSDNRIKTANESSHIQVTVAIFRHILNLFKFSAKIQLDLSLDPSEVNNFPVLDGVTATALRAATFDTTTIEAFCYKYPTQKSTALFTKLSGGLSPFSSIWKVEDIHFRVAENQASTILENFHGRILFINDAHLPETSVIKFMRNWMTGSAHQHLEVLHVMFAENYVINPRIIYEKFRNEAKVWNPSKRAENYAYNTQIIGCYKPHRFECSRFLDIERHSDGRRASFSVTTYWFRFCVWNIN
ncbi:unnamed protein product [Caenorhabditis brenneri]